MNAIECAQMLSALRAAGLSDYGRLSTPEQLAEAAKAYAMFLGSVTMPPGDLCALVAASGATDLPSAPELLALVNGGGQADDAWALGWQEAVERTQSLGWPRFDNDCDHPWTDPIAAIVIRQLYGPSSGGVPGVGFCGRDVAREATDRAQFRDAYRAIAQREVAQRSLAALGHGPGPAVAAVPQNATGAVARALAAAARPDPDEQEHS